MLDEVTTICVTMAFCTLVLSLVILIAFKDK